MRHRPFQPSMLLLLALLSPSLASAQDTPAPPERISGFVPEEAQAYEAAMERFRLRMNEFSSDARSIVDQLEREQREVINFGYNKQLQDSELLEQELRVEAMKRFTGYLAKYPNSEYAPHVMFRLADLYFVESVDQFMLDMAAHTQLVAATPEEDYFDLPPDPTADLSRSIELYSRILSDFPAYDHVDGTLYMLGYCYSESRSAQHMLEDSEETAKGYYERLVSNYPDSKYAAQANFLIGEYHFGNNDIELAIPYYQAVMARTDKDHELHDYGVYMLAWSQYKLSNYERALGLFTDLLDMSEEYFLESGKTLQLKPEAVEYTAISFADISNRSALLAADADPDQVISDEDRVVFALLETLGLGQRKVSPIEVHEAWFKRLGDKPYEVEVAKELADVLVQYDRREEAIDAYLYIQETWPENPDNPQYQFEVAKLYYNLFPPDPDAAKAALSKLNERYSEDSTWALANRNDPDALDGARKLIEDSLADVAIELHQRAQASGEPSEFAIAASKYKEYLQKFPFADKYYELSWYMAEAMYGAEQYENAIGEYEQLIKVGGHDFADGAQFQRFRARLNLLQQKYGPEDQLPQNAVVERTVDTPSGEPRPVYMLSDEHKSFIASADALKDAQFTNPDFAEALEGIQAPLYYVPAQILYTHGHYPEARERFEEIIAMMPRTQEAAFAAGSIVNSYTAEGDFANVVDSSRKYKMMQLGPDAAVAALKSAEFETLEQGASFKQAMGLIQKQQHQLAAEAFMQYLEDFPKSENAPLALYNAANQYEMYGKAERANELFEEYITTYPKGEFAEDLYYRIATNYASILELDKAINYYERLYRFFPKNIDASSALYMAGFLRTGKGDFRGAAENFEAYTTRFSDNPDAEQVYWLAGEQWKKISDADALRFYQKYLKKYPKAAPDHVIEARHWIATSYERNGDTRRAEKAWDELETNFASLVSEGLNIGPTGRNFAAEAAFRDLWAMFEEFQVIKYPKNEEKLVELLVNGGKKDDYAVIEAKCLSLIDTYQDFEYSSAALYVWGSAYLAYAEMLFNAPPPTAYAGNFEMEDIFRNALDEVARPLEEKAIARFQANLQKAEEAERSSVWIDRSIVALNDLDPANYPLEKPESRGDNDSSVVPKAGPVDMPAPVEEEAP